ncbi:MAG: AAA family ATPase, partial [Phycisphaerales bacterium]|nr:AAA family ATPase [Phycisphaerales bacterium]
MGAVWENDVLNLTPRQIVERLDRYIVGQGDAKRAAAIAIRNRWRRLQLPAEASRDVKPKNILMVGPTGVGKTEIARRIAQELDAPFVKVEATKFTEVGYHGRDVDSMIRELVDRAMKLERDAAGRNVRERAERDAQDRVLDQLLPDHHSGSSDPEHVERRQRTREKLRSQLVAGGLDDRLIEVVSEDKAAPVHMMSNMGLDQMGPEFERLFERMMPARSRRQRMPLPQALEILI